MTTEIAKSEKRGGPRGEPGWHDDVPFPERRCLRAADIRDDVPYLPDVIAGVWRRLVPRLGSAYRFAVANWAVTGAVVLLAIAYTQLPALARRSEARRRTEDLRASVVATVGQVLDEVGHGVSVTSVRAQPLAHVGATYSGGWRVITVNSALSWRDQDLLQAIGHECTHALFDQAGLSHYSRSLSHQIVEESAAEVLGAHLAGRVWSRQGHDGEALTRSLVDSFASSCSGGFMDPRRRLADEIVHSMGRDVSNEEFQLILSHYGNDRMVREMDRLCRESADPWEAAHRIAAEFRLDSLTEAETGVPSR